MEKHCILSIVLCILYLPSISWQQYINIDKIITKCRDEIQLNQTQEFKYAKLKLNAFLPHLDGGQNKPLLKLAYEKSSRQRPFECIAEKTRLYEKDKKVSRKDIESSRAYQLLVQDCKIQNEYFPPCNPYYPYRSIDGTCNNIQNPMWGSVLDCNKRLLEPTYTGVSGFRKSVKGGELPNAREISLKVLDHINSLSMKFNQLFAFFGQFLDHDITDTAMNSIGGEKLIKCCPPKKDSHPECVPIKISKDDPFYSKHNVTCFEVTRSAPCPTCDVGKRIQMNTVTSFLDASVVYSSLPQAAQSLRALDGTGKLKKQEGWEQEILPVNTDDFGFLLKCGPPEYRCFQAGDRRVNVHTALMSIHTLCFREHNSIAEKLKEMNPCWNEEHIYQEARKILGALHQVIVFKEFLLPLLGENLMAKYGLNILDHGRTRYEPNKDPSVVSEFSTAAFRLHSIINSVVSRSGIVDGRSRLKEIQFDASPIYKGCMGSFVRGMTKRVIQNYDRHIIRDLTEFLYKPLIGTFGFDLPAVNIQRGRDHGIPPYVNILMFVTGGRTFIKTFDDLCGRMPSENIRRLRNIYRDVKDIDAWVGMNLEAVDSNMIVGPTAGEIIALQFHRLKYGDRFYFEHVGNPPFFDNYKLAAIRNSSFAKIICHNTNVKSIQKKAFLIPRKSDNPVVSCADIPDVNLSAWKDKC